MSQTEVQLIKDAVIVNADVSNSAAIDVSKISGAMPLAGGTFTGDLTIPDSIIHSGDTDTKIRFPGTDIFSVETGGSERLRVDSSGLKIVDKLIHTGDTDTFLEFGTDAISLETGGSEVLSMNLDGLVTGGQTNPTSSDNGNIYIKNGSAIGSVSHQLNLVTNAVFDSAWKYITSSVGATQVVVNQSGFVFQTAASGTANNNITFSNRFNISNGGAIGVGGAYGSAGQVLTSGGGSGNATTWTTVTGTTINNNANNRLITGSGTANTLEGEAELSYSKESTSDHMLVLGGTDSSAAAWSGTRQGFKAIGSQPLLYLVDSGNSSGDDAYVGHSGSVLYIAKRGGSLAFQTAASGASTATKWTIGEAGHFEPNSTSDALNIGSASKRVANIFTNDLHLSNEGHSNDVDGTWGSYTIQEGAEDLFLINNRTGKKFKFNLTEVS